MRTPRHPQDFPICRPVISEDLCPLWKYPAFWGGDHHTSGWGGIQRHHHTSLGILGILSPGGCTCPTRTAGRPSQEGKPALSTIDFRKEREQLSPKSKWDSSSISSHLFTHFEDFEGLGVHTLHNIFPSYYPWRKPPEPGYTLFGVFFKGYPLFRGSKSYKPERSPFWCDVKNNQFRNIAMI